MSYIHTPEQLRGTFTITRQPHGLLPESLLANIIGVPLPVYDDPHPSNRRPDIFGEIKSSEPDSGVIVFETFDVVDALRAQNKGITATAFEHVAGDGRLMVAVAAVLGEYQQLAA